MAIPFLPPHLLSPTFNFIQMPSLEIPEMLNLEKLKKYFKKRWLNKISPEELLIFLITISTNNSAESYHSKLKGIVMTSHPRIWTFITTLNEILEDLDNDIGRLTEYCREEFEKFTTFYFKKVPKLVNFPSEKVVLVFCYDRYTSAVIDNGKAEKYSGKEEEGCKKRRTWRYFKSKVA